MSGIASGHVTSPVSCAPFSPGWRVDEQCWYWSQRHVLGGSRQLAQDHGCQLVRVSCPPFSLIECLLNTGICSVVNVQQTFAPSMIHQENPAVIINTGSKQGITNPPCVVYDVIARGRLKFSYLAATLHTTPRRLLSSLSRKVSPTNCATLLTPMLLLIL